MSTITISPTAIPLGQSVFGPFAITTASHSMSFNLVRTSLPDTGSILADCFIDVSNDGGNTYSQFFGTGIIGGTTIPPGSKTGSPDLRSTFYPTPYIGQVFRIRVFAYIAFTLSGLSLITT